MPVIVKLDVQAAKLSSTFGAYSGDLPAGSWLLTLKVKLPWRDRLELGTGEKLEELDLHLTFREATAERTAWAVEHTKDVKDLFKVEGKEVVGLMTYHPAWTDRMGLDSAPAAILFEAHTPHETMGSLIGFAQNGRFPNSVTVEVRGLVYGHFPDGTDKKWLDNKEVSILPIANVEFALPLATAPDETDTTLAGEPATPVGADLAPTLKETLRWVKGAVYLLAALAGAAVLRNWR